MNKKPCEAQETQEKWKPRETKLARPQSYSVFKLPQFNRNRGLPLQLLLQPSAGMLYCMVVVLLVRAAGGKGERGVGLSGSRG